MDILHEHGLHLTPKVHIGDDTWQLFQPGQLRGREPAVADDHGVALLPGLSRDLPGNGARNNSQILKDTVGLNAVGQLGQITQVLPRVVGMRVEIFDRDIDQAVRGVIVIIPQGRKEGLVHGLPIPPVTNRLLVVDIVSIAGIRRIVRALQLLADIFTGLPFALRL